MCIIQNCYDEHCNSQDDHQFFVCTHKDHSLRVIRSGMRSGPSSCSGKITILLSFLFVVYIPSNEKDSLAFDGFLVPNLGLFYMEFQNIQQIHVDSCLFDCECQLVYVYVPKSIPPYALRTLILPYTPVKYNCEKINLHCVRVDFVL